MALPLHPDYGLGPNVFYVPPLSPPKLDAAGRPLPEMRIPVDYLKSLFGPEVEQAMATLTREREKRRRGEASELMDTLIAYVWEDNFRLGANTREVL